MPGGLINDGKLINRSLTSGSRCSGWAAWSRVISEDAVDLLERQLFSPRPGFGLQKHLASRFALSLAHKQREGAVGLGWAALGSVREKSPRAACGPRTSVRSLLLQPGACACTGSPDFSHIKPFQGDPAPSSAFMFPDLSQETRGVALTAPSRSRARLVSSLLLAAASPWFCTEC